MNDTPTTQLPELSQESIDRIETELFARIAEEREPQKAVSDAAPRRVHRARRRWLTVGGIAAAFAAGVLITPPLLNSVGPIATNDAAVAPASGDGMSMDSAGGAMPEMAVDFAQADVLADASMQSGATAGRDIIASGFATVHVTEIAAASDAIADLATTHGGYVESTNIGETVRSNDLSMPVPPGGDYGWVALRIPADALSDAMADLSDIGEVRTSSVSKQDVTMQAVDLRARVEATRASVERLTELMAQTGTVSELIEAEMALSERQAQLESYEQQLAALDDQVAMSSLSVELTRIVPVTQADPAGFGDGLLAGWNGLIVSLNALVIAAGFMLPWLALVGVGWLIVWLIVRARRRARTPETH